VNLDIDKLLAAISLRPSMSFRKGKPLFKLRPGGKKKRSGAGFVVSNAGFDQFDKQKKDAIVFLKTKKAGIRKIMNWSGVDGGELDFGVKQRDVMVQCNSFPAELLRLAGSLALDIEFSQYPLMREKKKRKKPATARTLHNLPRRK